MRRGVVQARDSTRYAHSMLKTERFWLLAGVGSAILSACATTGPNVGKGNSYSGSLSWAQILERSPDSLVVTSKDMADRIKATGLPWRVRDNSTGIEMLLVPPGEFVMGMSVGDEEAMDDERPAHEVTITKPFYLGRTEVTQGQWIKIMGYNPSYFQEANYILPNASEHEAMVAELMQTGYTQQQANEKVGTEGVVEVPAASWPLETVTPADAEPFLRKCGLRLPTEAEWEYACRAGSRTVRPGELDEIAWFTENSEGRSHVVATKKANALGFYDMLGNVWEWCSDWYGSDYYSACEYGATDPKGPAQNDFRVARGGSWDHVAKNCRSSFRENHYMPDPRITDFGFRVARNP